METQCVLIPSHSNPLERSLWEDFSGLYPSPGKAAILLHSIYVSEMKSNLYGQENGHKIIVWTHSNTLPSNVKQAKEPTADT